MDNTLNPYYFHRAFMVPQVACAQINFQHDLEVNWPGFYVNTPQQTIFQLPCLPFKIITLYLLILQHD